MNAYALRLLVAAGHVSQDKVDETLRIARAVNPSPDGWKPMSEPPAASGRYVVAHRGGVGGDAYYNAPGVPGWSQLPPWRPTHWCEAPGVSAAVAVDVAPESFRQGVIRLANRAHAIGAAPSPAPLDNDTWWPIYERELKNARGTFNPCHFNTSAPVWFEVGWKAAVAHVSGVPGTVAVPRELLQLAANAINWHLEPNTPDEHEATWKELCALLSTDGVKTCEAPDGNA